MMKYYIVMHNKQLNTTQYKRYKCIEGFSKDKTICWQFSKQGALKIIERLKENIITTLKTWYFTLRRHNRL